MQSFKLLSALLCYPESELLAALPVLRVQLAAVLNSPCAKVGATGTPTGVSKTAAACGANLEHSLAPLLDYLSSAPLIRLQENYVATFDRSTSHSLHLFEHIHGESRDRGQAMVDLLEEYRKHGFELSTTELPDYVPLFLEFLAQLPEDQVQALLGDAIHVLAGNQAGAMAPILVPMMLLREHTIVGLNGFRISEENQHRLMEASLADQVSSVLTADIGAVFGLHDAAKAYVAPVKGRTVFR